MTFIEPLMPSAGRFTSQFAMVGLPLSFNQVVTVGDDKHHDHKPLFRKLVFNRIPISHDVRVV